MLAGRDRRTGLAAASVGFFRGILGMGFIGYLAAMSGCLNTIYEYMFIYKHTNKRLYNQVQLFFIEKNRLGTATPARQESGETRPLRLTGV